MANEKEKNKKVTEVRKPYMTGDIIDEHTIKSSIAFLGTLIAVFFISFIVCASASFDSVILRMGINLAVLVMILVIVYHNGAGRGAEAVSRGEILYQKKEKGQTFSETERKVCFHPLKGYATAMIGTIPFLVAAVILALNTSVQRTGAGTLPSWMQAYTARSDVGNALVNYTNPEGMDFVDYLRSFVRICIIPWVNIVGYSNKYGMMLVEQLSPVILLLPAAAYGTGYLTGRTIRTRIHTAISENEKKRIRRENKKRKAHMNSNRRREPEQLN